MISIITTIVYACISLIIIIAMRIIANKRMDSIQPDEGINTIVSSPYVNNVKTVLFWTCIVMVSASCGYIISLHANTIIASIELGVCYMSALAAAIIDLKTKTIPNFIPLSLVGIRLGILIYEILVVDGVIGYLISSLVGCFLCALLLVLANRISKGGIGAGDIKLLSCIGLVCGIYVVFSALLLSLIACIITSVGFLALKKKTSKDHLPFGPFIFIGFTAMCFFTLY